MNPAPPTPPVTPPATPPPTPRSACVELGGSGAQTVVFTNGRHHFADGIAIPAGSRIGVATPGHIDHGRISAANLGWTDVDPRSALDLPAEPEVIANDAAAAALGEWVLRGGIDDPLVFLGVGTGIGGAVVAHGVVTHDNLFGHEGAFGDRLCTCGRIGCLETVAGGWALPAPLDEDAITTAAGAIAAAVRAEPSAAHGVVVVTGGVADHNPTLVAAIAAALPDRRVVGSARPPGAKSAAAWGVRDLLGPRSQPVDVRIRSDADACAVEAADLIEQAVVARPDLNLGVATGSTPMKTYAELARRGIDLSAASIFLLDEYVGLSGEDPRSYRATVSSVFVPLGVDPARVHGPAPDDSPDLETAARDYAELIDALGGIDLQLLGIGRNGHIGFNEPGSGLELPVRPVTLTATTRRDNARFFDSPDDVPLQALTQGIGTILQARRLLLIATGANKAAALAASLSGPVTPDVPASAIRLHPDATVVADRAAATGWLATDLAG